MVMRGGSSGPTTTKHEYEKTLHKSCSVINFGPPAKRGVDLVLASRFSVAIFYLLHSLFRGIFFDHR